MYSVEDALTGSTNQHEKAQLQKYRNLLVVIWYTIFNSYILILVEFTRNMTTNLSLLVAPMGKTKNYFQAPKLSTALSSSRSNSTERCGDSSGNGFLLTGTVATSRTWADVNCSKLPKISSCPLNKYVESSPLISQQNVDVADVSQTVMVQKVTEKTKCETVANSEITEVIMTCLEKIYASNNKEALLFQQEIATNLLPPQCNKTAASSLANAVTPCQLVGLINNFDKLLLLDCRPFIAFNSNHIKGALNVSCSDRITRKRLVDGKIDIRDVVSGQDAKDLYRQLESEAEIVMYDEATTELNCAPATSSLKLLADCLLKKGKQPHFLEGGLQAFQKTYKVLCSQPETPDNVPLLFSPTSPEVNCDIDSAVASKILPYLFIGNQRDAANRDKLTELGISHVMNVTSHLPQFFEGEGVAYKRLPATDSGSQNLKQYFAEAIEFIEEAKRVNGRVLVHCQAGVSRSPTIVIAYLMATYQKPLMEAFSMVKDERNIVAPNINFMGQLLEFEQTAVVKTGLCPPSEPVNHLRM